MSPTKPCYSGLTDNAKAILASYAAEKDLDAGW